MPDSIMDYVAELEAERMDLQEQVYALQEQVKVLQRALHQSMSNNAEVRQRLSKAEAHAYKLGQILDRA